MHRTMIARVALTLFCCCTSALAGGTIYYVDDSAPAGGDGTSWATASNDLQLMLAIAGPGDEVRVAQGTYTPFPPVPLSRFDSRASARRIRMPGRRSSTRRSSPAISGAGRGPRVCS